MIPININDEKNGLASFSQQPDFDEFVKIFLIKIKKNEIFLYKQDADKKTKETVIKSIIESMGQSIFSNREIKPYDPVVTYNDSNHKFYKAIEGVTFSNGKLSITDEKNCVQLINAISDALVTAYISEVETVEEGRM